MVRSEEDVITLEEDLIKQRQADVNTVKAEDLLTQLNNNLAERKANYLILKAFTQKQTISRSDRASLNNYVEAFNNLKTYDSAMGLAHSQFILVCGKSDKQLEDEKHAWAPSMAENLFEESEKVADATEAKFLVILNDPQYKKEAILLKQFAPPGEELEGSSSSSKSDKAGMSKCKVDNAKKYIESSYNALKSEVGKEDPDRSFSQTVLLEKCQYLEKHIADFKEKLDEYSYLANISSSNYDIWHEWHVDKEDAIVTLKSNIKALLDKSKKEENSGQTSLSFGKFSLKNRKEPSFNGDELEYTEFKKKWASIVTVIKAPASYELDLLKENIPEEGKKRLYNCECLTEAWVILDKMYQDTKLISQKLKWKLKNLKLKATEEHDQVIELYLEVDYLVKRITALGSQPLLIHDPEYLNAIYRVLPKCFQIHWDFYDKSGSANDWAAFQLYLTEIYNTALDKRALMESVKTMPSKLDPKSDVCRKCGGIGHKQKHCVSDPENLKKIQAQQVDLKDADPVKVKNQPKNNPNFKPRKNLPCPECKIVHTYKKDNVDIPSKRFINCGIFIGKTENERAKVLEKHSACTICTDFTHKKADCTTKLAFAVCGESIGGNRKCTQLHSKYIHGSTVPYAQFNAVNTISSDSESEEVSAKLERESEDPTSMILQDIPVGPFKISGRVQWDSGSNKPLIRDDFAKAAGLKAIPARFLMQVVNEGWKMMEGFSYEVPLHRRDGKVDHLLAYGVPSISDATEPIDMSPVRNLFPNYPKDIFKPLKKKEVQVLIGLRYAGLFPDDVLKIGNLNMQASNYGKSFIISGSHPSLKQVPLNPLSEAAAVLIQTSRVEIKPPEVFGVIEPDIFDLDRVSLSTDKCYNCDSAISDDPPLTRKLKAEKQLLDEAVTIENGFPEVSFPFTKDPRVLRNNRKEMIKRAERQWQNLKKKGGNVLEVYNDQFRDFEKRGVLVRVSAQEIQSWEESGGVVNYITNHAVDQPNKPSTPVRVVTNSSINNNGTSLNNCTFKGPNQMASLHKLLLRFRMYRYGFSYDLSKCYHTLRTGPVEKFLRLLIWRYSEDDPWITFAFVRMTFGDRAASGLLETTKRKIGDAATEKGLDQRAIEALVDASYVDDGVDGDDDESVVDRLVGTKDADTGLYNGTLQQVCSLGDFKIKEIIKTGDKNDKAVHLLGDSVLGYVWFTEEDVMAVKLRVNLSKKRRKLAKYSDFVADNVQDIRKVNLTFRKALSLISTQYDPLGMISPWTGKLKVALAKMRVLEKSFGYDNPVPDECKEFWYSHAEEAVGAKYVKFPRTYRPAGSDGSYILFLSWDANQELYEASSYICWIMSDGSHVPQLIMSKCKINPNFGLTIAKMELMACLLSCQLLRIIIAALSSFRLPVSVVSAGDSKCTLASIKIPVLKYKPFFTNRVSEIQSIVEEVNKVVKVEDFYYISSKHNPSDAPTRMKLSLADLGPGSEWQQPSFLFLPRKDWPLSSEYPVSEELIPIEEFRANYFNTFQLPVLMSAATQVSSFSLPDLSRVKSQITDVLESTNNYDRAIRIIAYLIRASVQAKTFKELTPEARKSLIERYLTPKEIKNAEYLALLCSMSLTKEMYDAGHLASLLPQIYQHIIVTCGRVGEEAMLGVLGKSYLPILSNKCRLAKLLMIKAHESETNMDHRGEQATLVRSRMNCWIPKGKSLAKSVVRNCVLCKKERGILMKQQMAMLPKFTSTPNPPWLYITLDYAGPFTCYDEVKRRVTRKVWLVVFGCLSTKAMKVLPCPGYDADSFVKVVQRFFYDHGRAVLVRSDLGTAIQAGEKVINPEIANKLQGKFIKTEWQFISAKSPWRLGVAEAFVKGTKKSIHRILGTGTKMTYSELEVLCSAISYTLNQRPIGVRSAGDQENELQYFCPNQLLLGRSDGEGQNPAFEYCEDLPKRAAYVQAVHSSWWTCWHKLVFPLLIPCTKWREIKKNIRVDDICLLNYPNMKQDKYRLCKILEVFPDKKGLVRTARVQYRKEDARDVPKQYQLGRQVSELVSIQRLCMLFSPKPDPTNSTV